MLTSASGDAGKIPTLASAAGVGGGLSHAMWRPQMLSFLMSHGIKERDFALVNPDWNVLVALLDTDEYEDEKDAVTAALIKVGLKAGPSRTVTPSPTVTPPKTDASTKPVGSGGATDKTASTAGSVVKPQPTSLGTRLDAAERQRISGPIERSRKAFSYLYAALPNDLRLLIADVPQGYAYGIWSFLERRFRHTGTDNILALTAQLHSTYMESDETFDVYKARVDSLVELIVCAKETVSPTTYAALLLWKLRPNYSPAILALKTSGRLDVLANIDWIATTQYMAEYERSQMGLGVADNANDRALLARTAPSESSIGKDQSSSSTGKYDPQCFRCNKRGHIARHCPSSKKDWTRQPGKSTDNRSNGSSSHGDSKSNRSTQHRGKSNHDGESDENESSDEGKTNTKHRGYMARELLRRAYTIRTLGHTSNPYSILAQSDKNDREMSNIRRAEVDPRSYLARAMMGSGTATTAAAAATSSSATSSSSANDVHRQLKRLVRPNEPRAASPATAVTPSSAKKNKVSFGPEMESKAKEAARREPRVQPPRQLREPVEKREPRSKKPLDVLLRTTSRAVDSAATVSITGNKDNLVNVRRCLPMGILMADNTMVSAVYKGEMPLRLNRADDPDRRVRVTIKDVYFHERIEANLLSWGCMREEGWEMHSTKDGTHLITPKGTRVIASTRGKFTLLNDAGPERVYATRSRMGKFICTDADDLIQLHHRIGHVSWGRLIKMCATGATAGIGSIAGLSSTELDKAEDAIKNCDACTQGKQRRNSIGHHGLDHGKSRGEVLHMDTFYVTMRNPVTNVKYHQYCLLVTDAFTEMRWTAVEDSMRDIQTAAIEIIAASTTLHRGKSPRLIVTDLGSEFENNKVKSYCRAHGIHLQPTPARAKELNGIAEKSVDTVKNHVRAMLLASGVPDQLGWKYAVQHHAFLWNRTHIGQRTGTTPREASTGKESSILNFGTFGCDTFVHQDRTQRDTTFSAKALPGIYLGHDAIQNCPIVHMYVRVKQFARRMSYSRRAPSDTCALN